MFFRYTRHFYRTDSNYSGTNFTFSFNANCFSNPQTSQGPAACGDSKVYINFLTGGIILPLLQHDDYQFTQWLNADQLSANFKQKKVIICDLYLCHRFLMKVNLTLEEQQILVVHVPPVHKINSHYVPAVAGLALNSQDCSHAFALLFCFSIMSPQVLRKFLSVYKQIGCVIVLIVLWLFHAKNCCNFIYSSLNSVIVATMQKL